MNLFVNQRGSTIIYGLIIAGILGALALVVPTYFQSLSKAVQMERNRTSALLVKESLMSMLDNEAVWAATVNNPANANLACLRTPGATCQPNDFGLIQIFQADGTSFIDNAPETGIDTRGEKCTTLAVEGVDDSCLFRMRVTWECPLNATGSCDPTTLEAGQLTAAQPKVRLKAAFEFVGRSSQDVMPLQSETQNKVSRYSIDFIRGGQKKNVAGFCQSVNGLFDPTSSTCKSTVSPSKSFNCKDIVGGPAWFVGFSADGTPICAKDSNTQVQCPEGTAIVGYYTSGDFACGPF